MKVRDALMILLMCTVTVGAVGCGGGEHAPAMDPNDVSAAYPDWIDNPPRDPDFHLATGNATSKDPQLAVDKAELDAQTKLSARVNADFQAMITRLMEEVGSGEDAQLLDKTTRAAKRSAANALTGVQIRHQKTMKEGGIYRAFVMVEVPKAKTSAALLGGITKDEELYTRFRETQAFQAMAEKAGK
jgi:hypothetical protein